MAEPNADTGKDTQEKLAWEQEADDASAEGLSRGGDDQPPAEHPVEDQRGAAAHVAGVERWLQFAYIGFALLLFWAFDQLISWIWNFVSEPQSAVVLLLSALLAGGISVILFRHASVHRWSHDVAAELARVTWPPRNETWGATVVVIVTSIVAAVLMFVYDALWSGLTDFIYKF